MKENIDPSQICQLYEYDVDSFLLTKNSPEYFAKHFASTELLDDKNHWLNFHSLDYADEIEMLCNSLSIDRTTYEDIYTNYKRARLEEYDNYLYIKIKSALPRVNSSRLEEENISFIVSTKYLISFQEKSSDHFPEVRDRIELKKGKIRTAGTDFLLFRMLEAITDNYFEVLEDIVASIERLERVLVLKLESETLKKIEHEKRKLIELRKIVFPLKEVTSQLMRIQTPFLKKESRSYFSKLNDNCLTILEEIDANKQIMEGMNNLYYAVQGQKMNQIMKVLTIVSTIFIPLTFIVGVYGMNFKNMPELETKNGYYITWGVMILISVLLLWYFFRKGWLKRK
jgi:magnesium transporter